MTSPRFTEDQVEQYQRDGYAVIPGLLPPEALQVWSERLEAIVDGSVPPAPGMLVMKDVMVAKGAVKPGTPLEAIAKVQDFEKDPVLDTYTRRPEILACVEQLVGEGVMTIHTMLINKPPNVDGRHPLHQDLLYFPFRPADRIVASWTALEPVTQENGCLVVVPGSHKGELLQHENPGWEHVNGGYFGAAEIEGQKDQRVHLEMDPGDTVFFHPILLHGSGRNRTQGFRKAISAHYSRTDVRWEWTIDDFSGRKYRIVTGEREGEFWEGERLADGAVNPLDYMNSGAEEKPYYDKEEE